MLRARRQVKRTSLRRRCFALCALEVQQAQLLRRNMIQFGLEELELELMDDASEDSTDRAEFLHYAFNTCKLRYIQLVADTNVDSQALTTPVLFVMR